MSGTRARMRQRCTILRGSVTGQDERGDDVVGTPMPLATFVPCRMAPVGGEGERVSPGRSAVIRDWVLLLPSEQDVTSADWIADVSDRLGMVQYPGPFNITRVDVLPGRATIVALGSVS